MRLEVTGYSRAKIHDLHCSILDKYLLFVADGTRTGSKDQKLPRYKWYNGEYDSNRLKSVARSSLSVVARPIRHRYLELASGDIKCDVSPSCRLCMYGAFELSLFLSHNHNALLHGFSLPLEKTSRARRTGFANHHFAPHGIFVQDIWCCVPTNQRSLIIRHYWAGMRCILIPNPRRATNTTVPAAVSLPRIFDFGWLLCIKWI
jgi:hypothetical protein